MALLRGGCPVHRLANKTCGAEVRCLANANGQCWINSQDYPCNNTKKVQEVVRDCGGYWWPKPACLQGDYTGCGPSYQCACDQPDPLTPGTCTYDQDTVTKWQDHYHKDLGPPSP